MRRVPLRPQGVPSMNLSKEIEIRSILLLVVAGLASAFASGLGLLVGGWGGSYSFGPTLGSISWMLPTLSFPIFCLYFASRNVALACSWMLVGACTLFGFLMNWYPCMIEQHCGNSTLASMFLKTLVRSPELWGLFVASISMQLSAQPWIRH